MHGEVACDVAANDAASAIRHATLDLIRPNDLPDHASVLECCATITARFLTLFVALHWYVLACVFAAKALTWPIPARSRGYAAGQT
jgi:hypothetical protein